MWPKSKSSLNTHLISVHSKFKFNCVNTFPDNGRKPPFSAILWSKEGQNLANVTKKQIDYEQSPNMCTHQVWIGLREYISLDNGQNLPFSVILWPPKGHNLANMTQNE